MRLVTTSDDRIDCETARFRNCGPAEAGNIAEWVVGRVTHAAILSDPDEDGDIQVLAHEWYDATDGEPPEQFAERLLAVAEAAQ